MYLPNITAYIQTTRIYAHILHICIRIVQYNLFMCTTTATAHNVQAKDTKAPVLIHTQTHIIYNFIVAIYGTINKKSVTS